MVDPQPCDLPPSEEETSQGPAVATSAASTSGPTEQPFPVVGIGASAGGLEAITELLEALTANPGMAFVVVLHLDPEHKSALREILSRVSRLPVRDVEQGMTVLPDHVHVIPPNRALVIGPGGVLHLSPRVETRGLHMPVDTFLRSLAEHYRSKAIGVILSGTGSDGTRGVKAIKEAGGITFAQNQTARYQGMPRSAIEAGCIDAVLPPAQIAAELVGIACHPTLARRQEEVVSAPQELEDDFLQILRLLNETTGVDFLHYKHSTLRRRIERRLVLRRLQSLAEYLQCLRDDPAERRTLFEEVLISVTTFFRDPDVFEALKATVFPALLANRSANTPLRIWIPGCASGEEAYSVAICLLEHLGTRTDIPVKIFATDISERGIDVARAGVYGEGIASEVSPQRLQRFFLKTGRGYEIAKTVRDLCIFSRQNVSKDPPFSQIDLICCRNVLIYLGPYLQSRVLPIFHYALKPGGFLVLGTSETVGNFADLFEVVDKKYKFYIRTRTPSRLTFDYTPGIPIQTRVFHLDEGKRELSLQDVYREVDRTVLARYAPSGVIVDENLQVIQFRGDTGHCLKPPPGPPTTDLLLMAREGLLGDLRTTFDRARSENAPASTEGVRVRSNDHFRELNLEVIPITNLGSDTRYFIILFEERVRTDGEANAFTPRLPAVSGEEQAKDREISRLTHELDTTKAYLQSVIEQKEAGNEELRAANEEIVSANEELQSTNEELETAKEELQATNEELTTVNDELQNRIRNVNQLGDDLVNLIDSTNIPIVVVDSDLCIRRFTPRAQRTLNLRPGDVGRPIGDLNLGINVPNLEALIQEVIDTLEVKQREITDAANCWHRLVLRPYKTQDNLISGVVLLLIDIDDLKKRERVIAESRAYTLGIVETVREPLMVLDGQLRVQTANRAFYQMFQIAPEETEGQFIYELGNRQWDIPRLRTLLEEILPQNSHFENFEVAHVFPGIGQRTMLLNARQVIQAEEEPDHLILLAIEDITARKYAEEEAQRLANLVEACDDAIFGKTMDDLITSWNPGAEKLSGYTATEVIGQPISLLFPSATTLEDIRRINEQLLQGRGAERLDARCIRKDGQEVLVSLTLSPLKDEAGQVTGIAVVARDVTARKRTAQALRESEEKLRSIVTNAVDAIVVINEQGIIDSVNPATERLFGYTQNEMIGQNVKMLMPSPYREQHDHYLARYRQTGEKRIITTGREVQARRKDGSLVPADLSVSEFHDRAQRMFTGVLHDLSSRKALEREVLNIAEMEQRRIGQELHDSIGQELTALRLLVESLSTGLQQGSPTEAQLAGKVGEGLQRVLAQVRALSQGLTPVEVDSEGLMTALAELASRTSEFQGVTCTFDCREPVLVEDNHKAMHLYRIASEAITNALKHAQAQHITISLEDDGQSVILQVRDDGIGFPPEPLEDRGMGLKIMRYRAGLIKAELSIETAEPTGTLVISKINRNVSHA
jgi:two-component system CheB/CheR fusion protein